MIHRELGEIREQPHREIGEIRETHFLPDLSDLPVCISLNSLISL